MDPLIPLQPGDLALGVPAGLALEVFQALFQRQAAFQPGPQFLIADGVGGGFQGRVGQHLLGFLQQPLCYHFIHPPVDAPVQQAAVGVVQPHHAQLIPAFLAAGLLLFPEGLACQAVHLHSPYQADVVVGVDNFSGIRVYPAKFTVKAFPLICFCLLHQLFPQGVVPGGGLVKTDAVHSAVQIQPGPPAENGEFSPLPHLPDGLLGQGDVVADGKGLVGV